MVNAIEEVASRALGSSNKYGKLAVISLRWENGDLDLASIERELPQSY